MLNLVLAASLTVPWFRFAAPPPMPSPTRSGITTVNGARLWYAEFGRGTPVLLLHGGLMNSNYWAPQIRALEKHYRVIVFDSRGHGRSTSPQTPFSYPLLASDVVGMMDYLHLRSVPVVGWSDGAIVGIEVALHDPQRVTKLFAFGANSSPSTLILTPHADDRDVFEESIRQYRALSRSLTRLYSIS